MPKVAIYDAIFMAGFALVIYGGASIYAPLGPILGGLLMIMIGLRGPSAPRSLTRAKDP